jgi:hypothetical protein
MRDRALFIFAFLVGCTADVEERQGTQVGDEGTPQGWGCQETSRDPIDDASLVADGFAQSPDERWASAGAASTGEFFVDESLSPQPMSLEWAELGDWELVRSALPETTGTGPTVAIDTTGIECADVYERRVQLSIVVDGHLDETAEVAIRLGDDGSDYFYAKIDKADLVGPAEPLHLTIDPQTDEVWFSITGRATAGVEGWTGDASFDVQSALGGPSDPVRFTQEPYGSYSTLLPAGDTGL